MFALKWIRKIFWWQLTVTEVKFVTEAGITSVYHVHPAWWGQQRVFEDAMDMYLPGFAQLGETL